ncbi:hypothetical protein PMKS-000263 [Pichia membranifaciens]|uniref:Monopolin complex subunit Csm1/Pcs1 C-terminal domain-containing protein n=1 Tax=Pichia membranifaciens TaxID=4926 RepID=A0A1Q2YB86_9ASCO|nr:hypothetical protein PMKS-000263 [Pichia membranifaciens]
MEPVKRPGKTPVSAGGTPKKQKTQADPEAEDQDPAPKRLSLFDVIEKEDRIIRKRAHKNNVKKDQQEDEDEEDEDLDVDVEKDGIFATSGSSDEGRRLSRFADRRYASDSDVDGNGTEKTDVGTNSINTSTLASVWHDEGTELPDNVGNIIRLKQSSQPKLPTTKTISSMFQKKQLKKLTELLNDVKSQYPAGFEEYKQSVQLREQKSEKLISFLLEENKRLESKLKSLKDQAGVMKREHKDLSRESARELSRWKSIAHGAKEREDELESEILSLKSELVKHDGNAREVEAHETKLNFLELLTGVHCVDLKDEKGVLKFTIRQTGKVGSIHYRLIIDKSPSQGGSQDVIYEPLWEEIDGYGAEWKDNQARVKEALPEYLHRELSFPLNTLLMFNNKISVSLN